MTAEEHGESFHWPDPSADVVRRRLPPKRRHGRWGVVGKFLGYLTASVAATAAGMYEAPQTEASGGYRGAWAQWLDMTYIGDSDDSAWVARLDDLDARLSATFDGYFVGNELNRESFDNLVRDEGTLADIVPKMSARTADTLPWHGQSPGAFLKKSAHLVQGDRTNDRARHQRPLLAAVSRE